MENWGLITGRTSVFLLDPERGDLQAKKRVAGVQSHEVAHMWFGNITTMEWWNYLYLNEGFATLVRFMSDVYFIHYLIFARHPRWEKSSFLVNTASLSSEGPHSPRCFLDRQEATSVIAYPSTNPTPESILSGE